VSLHDDRPRVGECTGRSRFTTAPGARSRDSCGERFDQAPADQVRSSNATTVRQQPFTAIDVSNSASDNTALLDDDAPPSFGVTPSRDRP
jgi:hypothetical protein